MTKVETIGTVKNGVLTIVNRQRFQQELTEMKDCDVSITIKKKGKRSNQFNRFYFGVLLKEIMIELTARGYQIESVEDLHLMMKLKFNCEKVVDYDSGELIMELPKPTRTMNHEEYSEFVEKVRMWAASVLGIYVQDPGKQTVFNY